MLETLHRGTVIDLMVKVNNSDHLPLSKSCYVPFSRFEDRFRNIW